MTFKILSLDGGGFRGVITGRILQLVESVVQEKRGQSLHDYFDLIAGTSTGSLLAAGIALKMTTAELLKVYETRGKDIFPARVRNQRKWRFISQILGKRYTLYPHGEPGNPAKPGLSTVIRDSFGDATIASVGKEISRDGRVIEKPILLVLAYDTLSRNTTFFASNNPSGKPRWYDNLPIWRLCTASASAPTFFPPYKLPYYQEGDDVPKDVRELKQVLPHIDGGVSANNPTLAAISHALRTAESEIDNIFALSIGTGQSTQPFTYDEVRKWGLLSWVKNLPNIFLAPSSEISNSISRQILNLNPAKKRHLRLDFQLNNHLVDRTSGQDWRMLRAISETPINSYLGRQVTEDIDDPTVYQEFIDVAEAYIDNAIIDFNPKNEKERHVKDAIARFIELDGLPDISS
ncbi:MAG: patatin-like phospholipase family protein [Cyanothece sp. SIO2G6]|nr:patatin-like phospholipase family protein [Cyanothece sp. SIO2G6]